MCEERICKNEGCTNPVRPSREKDGRTFNYSICRLCDTLKSRYGVNTPERQAILDSQEGKCKCCGDEIEFTGDHRAAGKGCAVLDHVENPFKIRGVICGACNTSIGKLGDNIAGITAALKYVTENGNE